MNVTYRGRRAAVLENGALRVTVLEEGGHIAEIFDKRAGVSPLWTPPWASIEPSAYNPDTHPEYGNGPDAQLLAGIMGHNLCLDTFGAPSPEEFLAGVPVHGEASIVPYQIRSIDNQLVTTARLPRAGLLFERRLVLRGRGVHITEAVENLAASDRPIAWTQHVTLGPAFSLAHDSIPRHCDTLKGLRRSLWRCRLPGSRRRIRMAARPRSRRRIRRLASLQ